MRSWTRAAMLLVGASALVLGGLIPPAGADDGGDDNGRDGGRDNGTETVVMQDRCDPATFNAVFGPNFCVAHHHDNVVLDKLIGTIQKNPAGVLAERAVRGWRFHDDEVTLHAGQGLVLKNTGGETHSFTPVAMYGRGCIADVNALFASLNLPDACPAGGNFSSSALAPGHTTALMFPTKGNYRFECMIHPWMRTDVTVQ